MALCAYGLRNVAVAPIDTFMFCGCETIVFTGVEFAFETYFQ